MGNNNTPAPENDARFIAYVVQVKQKKVLFFSSFCFNRLHLLIYQFEVYLF
jgi:hypothetical protein